MLLCLLLATFVFAEVEDVQTTYEGVWWWTWSSGLSGLKTSSTNIGIAFSGWTNPTTAMQNAASLASKLPGTKFISLGGGDSSGRWAASDVTNAGNACKNKQFSGFSGIAFDIEEGDSGLNFAPTFAACKSAGYQVLVTVSHSAPYGISDASRLMGTFFSDTNIDFLSPQMYTTGTETSNDFTTSGGVAWTKYAGIHAKIVPSIVTGTLYPSLKSTFATYGVTTAGYIQWSQTMTYPPLSPSPTPKATPKAPSPVPKASPKPAPKSGFCVNSGEVCPSGMCCSQYGWCGSGAAYCGGSRVAENTTETTTTDNTNTPTADGSAQGSPLSTGALVAIIICAVLVAVLIVGLALFILTRKADNQAERF